MIPIKRGKDIDGMRLSGRLVAEVVESLRSILAPGIRTGEIDRYAAELIAARGGKSPFLGYRGFPGTICISVNEEVVHGIGGERMLQYGDLVKLDVGLIKDGWVGDTAATFPIGMGDAGDLKLIEVTQEALWAGIAQAREGNRIGDISAAIEACAQAHGMAVVREFVGHGVGRKLHEEPQVPNYGRPGAGPKLKAGMTLAIEPMVNAGGAAVRLLADGWTVVTADGRRSAHFEHTVLITKGEPEVLTKHGMAGGSTEKGAAKARQGAASGE
ncbi:methionyl aminopeptidase [Methylacidimicrobium cyclopophantes]|uniref:Methionine aminopeptidase n=1 Tax=Methylacidimicrobium cyclopophantes TaxID=1041766 RepID=A0A5E6M6B3_9BACT|nr:type I methionyl aminopeptidase [Methylacidimicrobium cyclopophantes]VVM04897.1 methionyl aminopeptidase [Methylacidimicrobium cyclopophantes]